MLDNEKQGCKDEERGKAVRHRTTTIRAVLLAVLLGGGAGGARALYRGDEYDPRSYTVEADYFLDRLSYLPDLESIVAFRDATNAYLGAGGSITKRDLFAVQELKLQRENGPWAIGLRFEMDQDFDGDHVHFFVGLSRKIFVGWALEFVSEPMPSKELVDLGLALVHEGRPGRLRAELLLPNAPFDDKNRTQGSFKTRPVAFRWEADMPLGGHVELFTRGDVDLPSETDFGSEGFDFSFRSAKPALGCIWNIAEGRTLWTEWSAEDTRKERMGHEPASTNDFVMDRTFYSGRIEYIHVTAGNWRWSVGGVHARIDESKDWHRDTGAVQSLDHESRILYGTCTVPLRRLLDLRIGAYLDYADHDEVRPAERGGTYEDSGLQGKAPLSLVWSADRLRLEAGVATQLDQLAFGGGFARIRALF